MGRYCLRRLMQIIPVVLLMSLVVFAAMQLAPGDPAIMRMGRAAARPENQAALEALRKEMGLDKPMLVQYFLWLSDAVRGDFGLSNRSERPVFEMIGARLPASLLLIGASLVLSLLVAIPLGTLSALMQRTFADHLIMTFSVAGVAIPGFWLGLILILIFSVKLDWLPPSGYVPFWEDPAESLKRVLLPAITLSSYLIATFARFLRADMIEVLQEDYVRTARAKGLRLGVILRRHVMQNALMPMLTVMGIEIGGLMGGMVIVEQVFGWSGVGWLTLQGIFNRDYPLVQGAIVLMVMFYILTNFSIDILNAFINPRIRAQYAS